MFKLVYINDAVRNCKLKYNIATRTVIDFNNHDGTIVINLSEPIDALETSTWKYQSTGSKRRNCRYKKINVLGIVNNNEIQHYIYQLNFIRVRTVTVIFALRRPDIKTTTSF